MEVGQLGYCVILVLVGQVWILGWDVGVIGVMVVSVGWYVFGGDVVVLDVFVQLDGVFVFGGIWFGCLGSQVGGDVMDVFI